MSTAKRTTYQWELMVLHALIQQTYDRGLDWAYVNTVYGSKYTLNSEPITEEHFSQVWNNMDKKRLENDDYSHVYTASMSNGQSVVVRHSISLAGPDYILTHGQKMFTIGKPAFPSKADALADFMERTDRTIVKLQNAREHAREQLASLE